ncbi:unnamed protein product [Brassica rapa subsp. trilocularis]
MQLIFFFNKPHGMAVQGGTGVKASVDELYATTCLTFDKSESLRLVSRAIIVMCTDLTETVVDFWCWEEHKRLQRFFIVYSSRKQLVSVAYVKPLLKGDRFLHAITEYRVVEFSPLGYCLSFLFSFCCSEFKSHLRIIVGAIKFLFNFLVHRNAKVRE